jgi:tetratricopeptide (TPR) repeat protein
VSLLRDPDRRAEASLALGHALYWAGEEEQGVEVLERALAEQPNLDVELRHRLEAEFVVNATRVSSQYERARERLAQLDLSLDEGPGARTLIAGRAYHEAVGGGDADHAAATALAALTAMSDEERARNYTGGAYALLYTDRLDEGIRLLDATLADVRRRGAVFHFSSLSMTRAIFQYARGALVEAEADGRAALEALPHQEVWFRWAAHGWLAQILVERGAVEEAAGLIEAVEPTVPPDAFSRAPLLRAGALVEAARGDHRGRSREPSSSAARSRRSATPTRRRRSQPGARWPRSSITRSANRPRHERWRRRRSSLPASGEHRARSAAACGSSV